MKFLNSKFQTLKLKNDHFMEYETCLSYKGTPCILGYNDYDFNIRVEDLIIFYDHARVPDDLAPCSSWNNCFDLFPAQ